MKFSTIDLDELVARLDDKLGKKIKAADYKNRAKRQRQEFAKFSGIPIDDLYIYDLEKTVH